MAMHYGTILAKYMNCAVPVAFVESGTGKTTALRCGLALVGASSRFLVEVPRKSTLTYAALPQSPLGLMIHHFKRTLMSFA